ncbi:MAG: heavy metal translocating P-type ATPase [Candidatus Cloacimonadaceae bacterium]|nr:heavy metal translocating P-type ATPase [Candidatus Cloacimonadaceae bacterium]
MIQKINIGIDGMHCASCSANVEKVLGKLPGVILAHVNLALEEASIEFDERRLSPEQINKAIIGAGYSVREEVNLSEDEQIRAMKDGFRRMMLMWAITIVITVFMVPNMLMGKMLVSHSFDNWFVFILTLGALLFPARGVYISAFKSVKSGSANMDVLIAMGTLAAFAVLPLSYLVEGVESHNFIGIAAMILAFHLTGRYLEYRARGKASEAIRKLVNLGAKTALIMVEGVETEVPIRKIKTDDVFIVKPGMKIPTDGVIINGQGNIDESMATGESMPLLRKAGDPIIGATINTDGYFSAKATKIGSDTFLAQVIKLVQDAQHSKVPIQLLADKVTAIFVPTILVLASLTFAVWMLFPETMAMAGNFLRGFINIAIPPSPIAAALMAAIATLVIACPCALGLATPTALMVGSGIGANRGILIRNGEALQRMKDIKAIVFDKTGTLTHGKPELVKIQSFGADENEILVLAASLESGSEHPLAKAILKAATAKSLTTKEISGFENNPGKGVSAIIAGQIIHAGSLSFIEEKGISASGLDVNPLLKDFSYASRVYLADKYGIMAVIYIADSIRSEAREVIQTLKSMGIEPIMLSGDNQDTADAIAAQCGISRTRAKALPADKVNIIRELQHEFGAIAMVGDGINDAPALKQADIGIAMGQGTDIAIEAADITIMRDNLHSLPIAINLSVQTFRKIRQNLFWAFFYNLIAIPLAVIGILHPIIAEIAMASSSVTVVTNANLLKRKKI